MKKIVTILTLLGSLQVAHSQSTSVVPGLISYQGRALDATGAVIGLAAPVNRTVTFRIWDHSSNVLAANLLYSEQQTVTISGGEFSVLIGQGVATSGTAFGYSETTKGTPTVKIGDLGVFGGATRFLGVTIDDGTAAVDNEITPRQQIVSSAFSLRSKFAEQLGANGTAAITTLDSGRVGIGTTAPPALFTVSGANTSTSTSTPQLLVTADDISERLRIGVDSTGNGTGFIQSFKEGSGAQNLLLNPSGGNVGIGGATSPAVALSVTGAITATGAITGGSFSTAGALTATGAVTGGSFSTAGAITGTGIGITGPITASANIVTSGGNLGVGTTSPGSRLTIADGADDGARYGSLQIVRPATEHTAAHLSFVRSGNNVMGLGYGQSSSSFGFGNGVVGAFSPSFLAIDTAGNVGMGTTAPTSRLHVVGAATVSGNVSVGGKIHLNDQQDLSGRNSAGVLESCFWPRAANGTYLNYGTNGLYIRTNASVNTMIMGADGRVRIGTNQNTAMLSVGSQTATYESYGKLNTTGASEGNATRTNNQLSIHALGNVLSVQFDVDSDIRIKTALKPSDSAKDLETLMGIQVTDYQFKDTASQGNAPQKKVIAQQVEAIYPQAVSSRKGIVPDIYQNAVIKDGWVMLATDLEAGERVRIISPEGEAVEEVLEARADAFRIQLDPSVEKTFVYGREVKDFHSVDYDAIAMLNVSATQQLVRELKTAQDEVAALRRELAAKDETMEARLIALERRLSQDGGPSTVSVSTNPAAR